MTYVFLPDQGDNPFVIESVETFTNVTFNGPHPRRDFSLDVRYGIMARSSPTKTETTVQKPMF